MITTVSLVNICHHLYRVFLVVNLFFFFKKHLIVMTYVFQLIRKEECGASGWFVWLSVQH